jgi:NAD(P)-dependent dehydrogenase (short-subunit alcohol dehydrogenase family)
MPGLLSGHVAVVTGAGSGIGRAIALGFAREGARLAVLDINGATAAETAAAIRDGGGTAHAFTLDVTDRSACRGTAAKVASETGAVSILVNNAGINRRNAFTGDADAVVKDWHDLAQSRLICKDLDCGTG